jgi:uncharacterized protein (DUF1919 family)
MDLAYFIKNQQLSLRWRYTKLKDDIGWNFSDKYFSWTKRLKLQTKNSTIISNDCVTGVIYHRLGLQYSSPTIWTYIFPDEYLMLLQRLKWYLEQPLKFTEKSKHTCIVQDRSGRVFPDRHYPVGVLGGDVEIHFLHSKTQEEALEQWKRRVQRINYDNLFIVFVDNDDPNFKQEYFEEFTRMPFEHRLFVSKKYRGDWKYAVQVKNKLHLERSINLVDWLNGGSEWLIK